MNTSVGSIVRYHRKRSGLTQLQLAEMGGVGKTTVFDVEKGKTTVRLDSLLRILRVLNIRMELRSPLMEAHDREQDHAQG